MHLNKDKVGWHSSFGDLNIDDNYTGISGECDAGQQWLGKHVMTWDQKKINCEQLKI